MAYLGAAELISEDNLKTDKYFSLLKNTDIIYMESFFLPKRISVACFVQEFCEENNKLFTFNLSAPYMSETHPNDMTHFVKKSDIIFGNQKEFSALAKAMNLCITLEDFIVSLSNDYAGKGTPYGKIIVMTNGSKTVTCAHSNGKVEQVLVPPIEISKIGDTTGAGDAFVAGFMAGLIKNRMPNVCLKWGCWVATQIIQQVGCTVPQYSADYLENIV